MISISGHGVELSSQDNSMHHAESIYKPLCSPGSILFWIKENLTIKEISIQIAECLHRTKNHTALQDIEAQKSSCSGHFSLHNQTGIETERERGPYLQVTLPYKPYFYVACQDKTEKEVAAYLMKKFSGKIFSVAFVQKEDLDLVSLWIHLLIFSIKQHCNKQYRTNCICSSLETTVQLI